MSDEELKNIGAFVVWLERNGNNPQQSVAQSFITNAQEWAAANAAEQQEGGAS